MKVALIIVAVIASAQLATANKLYRITQTTHSETQNLSQIVIDYYGASATVADWEEIKAALAHDPDRLQQFYELVGLRDEDEAICTRNGEYFSGSIRQYYLQRFDSGPYGGFLVHDQIGSLYLGSWYDLNMNVIASTTESAPYKKYAITHSPHPVEEDIEAHVDAYFGSGANVADWTDIKNMVAGDAQALADFYQTVGLEDGKNAVCLHNGNRFYSGNRQYFMNRFDSGPHAGFLVHDSVGTLYLGSWYGFNANIIAERSANGIGPIAYIAPAVEVYWNSKSNAVYQLQGIDSLSNTNWADVGDPMTGTGETDSILISTRVTSNRFFRVNETD